MAGPSLPPREAAPPGAPSLARAPDTKAGRRAGTPLRGASRLPAPRTYPIEAEAPGPRRLRHSARRFPRKTRPPGSLPARLPAPRSLLLPPLRGSVGAAAPGLGGRGGGSGSTTTWPPDAGPRRPGSRGSEKGGARLSPPLPPRAAPNSASQVTRPRARPVTCGRCSQPHRRGRHP